MNAEGRRPLNGRVRGPFQNEGPGQPTTEQSVASLCGLPVPRTHGADPAGPQTSDTNQSLTIWEVLRSPPTQLAVPEKP